MLRINSGGNQLAFTVVLLISQALTLEINAVESRSAHAPAQQKQTSIPSFASFQARLLAAVKNHDRQFVEKIISPNIEMALGGEKGKTAFLKEWDDLSEQSIFWARLQRVLEHGAQKDDQSNEYHSPAVAIADAEANEVQGIIWNSPVKLHHQPQESSKFVLQPGKMQVSILEPSVAVPIESQWVKIRTKKNVVGYIKASDIFSAYDEFAVFKPLHGQWSLTWFGFAGL